MHTTMDVHILYAILYITTITYSMVCICVCVCFGEPPERISDFQGYAAVMQSESERHFCGPDFPNYTCHLKIFRNDSSIVFAVVVDVCLRLKFVILFSNSKRTRHPSFSISFLFLLVRHISCSLVFTVSAQLHWQMVNKGTWGNCSIVLFFRERNKILRKRTTIRYISALDRFQVGL